MQSWKVKHIWDRIVVLSSRIATNKNKDEFLVPTMDLSDELSAKQKEIVAKIAKRFSSNIDDVTEDVSEPTGEEVKPEDIKLDDLDNAK